MKTYPLPQPRNARLARACRRAVLCVALCTGGAWANEGTVGPHPGTTTNHSVPPSGKPAPGEVIPTGGSHDPLHPGGGASIGGSDHPAVHGGADHPGPIHPFDPLHPENPGGQPASRVPESGNGNGQDARKEPGQLPGHVPSQDHNTGPSAGPGAGDTHGIPARAPTRTDSGQQYLASMNKAEDWQNALRGKDAAGASVWESLMRVYNRVMGNPRLPEHFGDVLSLPQHLQDLMRANDGNYAIAMRSNLGDLDRELLRATYDKDYYREPLMGYRAYDAFASKHGGAADYRAIQELSPADRLQYLVTFGRQSKTAKEAAQRLEQDLRALNTHDPQMAELDRARAAASAQTKVASFIYQEMVRKQIAEVRKAQNADQDPDEFDADTGQPSETGGGGEFSPTDDPGHLSGGGTGPQHQPATPSSRHQATVDAVTRHRIVWQATRSADPDLFGRLSAAYDRAMGNVKLPATFNDVTSLPEHLQTLIRQSGGYDAALRGNPGDLDRELLRATFDPSFYKEPLMGYAPYARFLAKHGDGATFTQIQQLSPPDRLQYLANHGTQSADEAAAVQARIQDYQRSRQANEFMGALQALRDEMRKHETINFFIADQMLSQSLDEARKMLDFDDDF